MVVPLAVYGDIELRSESVVSMLKSKTSGYTSAFLEIWQPDFPNPIATTGVAQSALPDIAAAILAKIKRDAHSIQMQRNYLEELTSLSEQEIMDKHPLVTFKEESLEKLQQNVADGLITRERYQAQIQECYDKFVAHYPGLSGEFQQAAQYGTRSVTLPPSYQHLLSAAIYGKEKQWLHFPDYVIVEQPVHTMGLFQVCSLRWLNESGDQIPSPYYALRFVHKDKISVDIGLIGQLESDESGIIQRLRVCQKVLGDAIETLDQAGWTNGTKLYGEVNERLQRLIQMKRDHYEEMRETLNTLYRP